MYGATGAGKSSLLMACLQELVAVEGKSLMNGSVSYASQRAWIQNATVRLRSLMRCNHREMRRNYLFDPPYLVRGATASAWLAPRYSRTTVIFEFVEKTKSYFRFVWLGLCFTGPSPPQSGTRWIRRP